MQGYANHSGIKHFFILGAGFSKPAHLPLCDELLPLIYRKATNDRFDDGESTLEILTDSLSLYYPNLKFSNDDLNDLQKVDIEKYLSYVAVTSVADTKNHHDEHGNQELSFLKRWLGQTIIEHEQKALQNLPDLYGKFAKMIGEIGDTIIFNFNWDTILEQTLSMNSIKFNFDSRRHLKQGEPSIHKMHGSVNWFLQSQLTGYPSIRYKPVADSLNGIVRVCSHDASKLYDHHIAPWIISPSYDKVHQMSTLQGLWEMLYLFFQNEGQIVIIGYSLRADDYHSYAMIYPQLVRASQEMGLKVKVIDYAKNREEEIIIRQRYLGVKDVEFYFNGWEDEALEFINA